MTTDKKVTDLTAITTPADEDVLYIVDADNTTDDPAGSSRRITYINLTRSVYGEISVQDNTNATTLNSAAKVQVTDFDTNGASSQTTPDHTNDHITVSLSGDYLCVASVGVENQAVQAHKIGMFVYTNNGATAFNNLHVHRDLAGGTGDRGSISMSGIISLTAGDTVELWADTNSASDRDVIFEDVTLSLVRLSD